MIFLEKWKDKKFKTNCLKYTHYSHNKTIYSIFDIYTATFIEKYSEF